MSSADPQVDLERVASEGLDHIFTHSAKNKAKDDANSDSDAEVLVDQAEGLTVAQTAVLLGFDQRAVVKLIKEHKLCAKKSKQSRSWVVELECVQAWLQKLGFGAGTVKEKGESEADTIEAPGNHQVALANQFEETDETRTLWYKLEMAGQQLRAASYRIGYLESQVDVYRQQMNLLPDLQAQAARGAAAESDAHGLQKQLDEAQAELEQRRRPWWQRWLVLVNINPC